MMSLSKQHLYAVGAAAILAGCGTTNTTIRPATQDTGAPVSIGFFKQFQEAAYAVMEKTEQGWRIRKLTAKRPVRDNENQEIVAVDAAGARIQPAYARAPSQFNQKGELVWFDCSEVMAAMAGKKQTPGDYGGCGQSAFTKIDVVGTVGKNAVAGIITLGLAGGTKRQVDTDAMNQALQQSGAYETLQAYLAELRFLSQATRDVDAAVNNAKAAAKPTIKISDPTKLVIDNVKVTAPLDMKVSYVFAVDAEVDLHTGTSPVKALQDLHHRIEAKKADLLRNTTLSITCGKVSTSGFEGKCLPESVFVRLGEVAPPFVLTVTSNKGYLAAKAERTRREKTAHQQSGRKGSGAQEKPIRDQPSSQNVLGSATPEAPKSRVAYWSGNLEMVDGEVICRYHLPGGPDNIVRVSGGPCPLSVDVP